MPSQFVYVLSVAKVELFAVFSWQSLEMSDSSFVILFFVHVYS